MTEGFGADAIMTIIDINLMDDSAHIMILYFDAATRPTMIVAAKISRIRTSIHMTGVSHYQK